MSPVGVEAISTTPRGSGEPHRQAVIVAQPAFGRKSGSGEQRADVVGVEAGAGHVLPGDG
jgi:hypothetical protein